MDTVYSKDAQQAAVNSPRYRGATCTKPISAAKEAVSVLELAERLTGRLRRVGDRHVARCPLPDHDEHTPSFTVYPDDGGWWCYGCNQGGDVVRLAQLAWGHPDDGPGAATAAAMLLMEFGHKLPARPPTWFRKQQRQQKARDLIDRERVEHVRMLVFRLIWMPWLRRLPEWVREEATASAWAESRPIALRIYEQRRGA